MLIQPRNTVIPDLDAWKERQRPGVPCPKNNVVDIWDRRAVDKVDSPAVYMADGRTLQNVRVVEGLVAKVTIRRVAYDDGVDGVQGRVGKVEGDVGRRNGRSNDDNTLEQSARC